MAELVPPYRERAELVGETDRLLGILTEPEHPNSRAPAAVFLNAGIVHRIGPNRLYVHLARALAREGVPSFRFDFSGIGDSRRPSEGRAESQPEAQHAEVARVLGFLRSRGVAERFVLIGLCSGADSALLGLLRMPEVTGAVLLDPHIFRTRGYYLRYYGPRLFDPFAWWRSLTGRSPALRHALRRVFARPGKVMGARERAGEGAGAAPNPLRPTPAEMRRNLRAIVDAGGRALHIFTSGLPGRYYYRDQVIDAYPDVHAAGLLEFEYYPDADHTFSTRVLRERLEERVTRWFRTTYALRSRVDSEPGAVAADAPRAAGGIPG